MDKISTLSWLYWDPQREAFTIPYFDLPVMWYGVIFAAGFFVGYFLLIPIIRNFIWNNKSFFSRDVNDWSSLANQIKSSKDSLISSLIKLQLSKKNQHELNLLQPEKPPSEHLKEALIVAVNKVIQDPTNNFNRKTLEDEFPNSIIKARTLSATFTDHLTWFIVIGTIIGARLGHVFFYDWPYYQAHPEEIFMLRKGGLASHGGTLGVLIAIFIFMRWNRKKYPDISLITLLDLVCIPTAFAVCCIRIANFFNQEILGNESTVPWAVIFGHPADGSEVAPRHPAQLYEALVYFCTFVLLYTLWKVNGKGLKPGTLSGLFFLLVFGSRFFIEFLKTHQSMTIDESFLQMGQYLSIPFIFLGLGLLFIPRQWAKPTNSLKRIV